MHAKDIIQLNNNERKALSKENLELYEEVLVYIRLNSLKSEQKTEELLLEILNHMLEAQADGKSASDVFGNDYKDYCDEIIKEIPVENYSKTVLFMCSIAIEFLAIVSFIHGILGFGLYHFFKLGSDHFTFSLGSAFLIIIIELLLLYLFIKLILKWLKSSSFRKKQTRKWFDFLQIWGFCTFYFILFFLVAKLMPSFGPTFSTPVLILAGIGSILYLTTYILNKKLGIR